MCGLCDEFDLEVRPAFAARTVEELAEHVARCGALAIDVAARHHRLGRQADAALEAAQRLRIAPRHDPVDVGLPRIGRQRIGRHQPAIAAAGLRALAHRMAAVRSSEVGEALAVTRHERVEIDQPRDALARAVGHAGRHHAPVAVADQYDVVQILAVQRAAHVGDMGVEVVLRARQMLALAKAGVGGNEDLVPGRRHQGPHLLPRPAGGPRPVGDDECGHGRIPKGNRAARTPPGVWPTSTCSRRAGCRSGSAGCRRPSRPCR